jgi:hypothetical protein
VLSCTGSHAIVTLGAVTTPQLNAPYAGVLLLPDRQPFGTTAPVTLDTGQQVAMVRWHRWSVRARFDILDAAGSGVLAEGQREGFWGRRFAVVDPTGRPLLDVKFGGLTAIKSSVVLPNGTELTAHGNWTSRKFSVEDGSGAEVARLVTTSAVFSFRSESLALELLTPVLSIVQAAALAQCIRAAVEAQNASPAGT